MPYCTKKAFTMNAQYFLTLLFEAIALGFIAIATFDFITGLIPKINLVQQVSPDRLSVFDLKLEPEAEALPLILDPWTLPLEDIAKEITESSSPVQYQHKPLLLLPQAQEVVGERSPISVSAKTVLDELLVRVDLEELQLRPARKIAKVLGIAQKVNGRDRPLSFLRSQIKNKLQQSPSLELETIEAVQREF